MAQSDIGSAVAALEDLDGAACAAVAEPGEPQEPGEPPHVPPRVAEPVEPHHVPQSWSGTGTQSRVFDLQYFQDIVLYTTWTEHNVALKYLRAE